MRPLLILLAFLITMNNPSLLAQSTGLHLGLQSGAAIPQRQVDETKNLINNGLQLGGALSYLGTRFGLEWQGAYFKNALGSQAIGAFEDIPAAADLQLIRNDWRSLYGSIGPVLRLGRHKLDWQLSPKVGWINRQVPSLGRRSKAAAGSEELPLGPGGDAKWQSFWSVGSKLQWQLSNRLGVQLAMDYLALRQAEISAEHIHRGLQQLGLRKEIKPVQDLVMQIAKQNGPVLQLGAGLTYRFGAPAGQEEQARRSCEPSFPVSPAAGTIFLVDSPARPTFSWTNASQPEVKYYHFQLFLEGQLVYERETEQPEVPHDDELEAIYQKGAEQEQGYTWQITTYFSSCEPLVSTQLSFRMSNRSGAFHDIFDLACDEPAYNEQGDLRLTGKISFFNNLSVSDPLIINNFNDVIIQDVSGTPIPGVSLTNVVDCITGLPVATPITVPPGGTLTFCFKLVVPAGHTAIRSEAHGTINGLPQLSTDQDDLPSCSCTVCDRWQFSGKASTLNYVTYGGNFFNAMIFQDIQIANSAPIREVKAEVVYVEHVANDPQCYTCTKHHNDMGLMSFHPTRPMVVLTNGNWKNNKLGYKGPGDAYDINGDHYVNQVIWQAQDPVNGVDFNSSAHRFRIPLNLPEPSSLKCCDHRYEVCVRYTFTDVNCVTCDYLVCYRMSPKGSGGLGTGGTTPHTGIDLGEISLPVKPTIPSTGNRPKGGN